MAVTNSKVLFCYVPHNKTMPASPDANTVYFLEDAQELWVGNKLIASNAMTEPPTFNIVGTGDFIANAEYNSATNTLTLTKSTLPVYTITKQQTADTGYSATYQMFKDGVATGDKINIPLDMVIESAEYKVVETADVPYEGAEVGDPYIDFTIANSDQTHLYVPLKDLVDVYTGGTHITVTNNVINHDSQGSDASTPMGQDIPSPGQGQTGTINVSGQVAYDSLGHVISVTVKNIYSSVKTIADASAAAVGADKVDKINSPTGDMIAKSTSTGNVAETSISVSDLTGAFSDISDLQSDKMDKIANASGDKLVVSTSGGDVEEFASLNIGNVSSENYELLQIYDLGSSYEISNSGLISSAIVTTGYDLSSAADVVLVGSAGVGNNNGIAPSSLSINNIMHIISGATGSKVVSSSSDGSVFESELAISDIATLDYIGTIPQGSSATDVIGYIDEVAGDKVDKISNATGGKITESTAAGGIVETAYSVSDLRTSISAAQTDVDALETLVGTIPAGATATTIVDYADEVADAAVANVVDDLDLTQVGGAGYYLTAVSQTDGQVAASATLADTAVTNASSNLVTSGAVYTAVANATPTWTVVE